MSSAKEKIPKPKGHWPKGKRRNPVGDWPSLRLAVAGLIDEHFRYGVRSASALARVAGVDGRTARRWLHGEDMPPPGAVTTINAWLKEQQKIVADEKKRANKGAK